MQEMHRFEFYTLKQEHFFLYCMANPEQEHLTMLHELLL
jgi:hypothetical protein